MSESNIRKAKARKVDPLKNADDLEVLFLGLGGQSRAFIQSRTNLTSCQIGYRLKKEGIRLSDFRNGQGIVAEYIFSYARPWIENRLRDSITPKYKPTLRERKG